MELIEVKITGLAELQQKLETIPLRAAKKIIKTSLKEAAEIWLKEMKARVHQGRHWFKKHGEAFGVIERSIVTKPRVTSELAATIAVGVSEKVFWAKFVEFGTRARRKGASIGDVMAASPITGLKTRYHRHRGGDAGTMPPFPFARPTFDATKQDVQDKFIEGVKNALAEEGLPLS